MTNLNKPTVDDLVAFIRRSALRHPEKWRPCDPHSMRGEEGIQYVGPPDSVGFEEIYFFVPGPIFKNGLIKIVVEDFGYWKEEYEWETDTRQTNLLIDTRDFILNHLKNKERQELNERKTGTISKVIRFLINWE